MTFLFEFYSHPLFWPQVVLNRQHLAPSGMVSTNKVVVLLPLTGTQKLVTCVFGTGPKDWNHWMWSKRNRSQSSILAASKNLDREEGLRRNDPDTWRLCFLDFFRFWGWCGGSFSCEVFWWSVGTWQSFLFKAGLSISSGAKASWLKGWNGSLKIPPLWNCFKWEEKT